MSASAASAIGRPLRRVDGRAKVTGTARYAGEFTTPGLLYGFAVSSTVAKGRITRIDVAAALAVPGVLHVFTHENRPELPSSKKKYVDDDSPGGSPFRPLYDDVVRYSGQPIALVVAASFESARFAASLLQIDYDTEPHVTSLEQQRATARAPRNGKDGYTPPPPERGHAEKAWSQAAVQIDAEYHAPIEHHNPMEPHASTVLVEADGTLTIYDKTQGVQNCQRYVAQIFGLPLEKVRIHSPFVGGAFGAGLRPQYQLFLAVMAALALGRAVRVTLTRQQMFTFGYRPATLQRVALGADSAGKLQAVIHEADAVTSQFEDYVEVVVNWSAVLYQSPHARFAHRVVPLDLYTPLDMRAPGAVWGLYALECAMDELAAAAGADPLALRLLNYTERDEAEDKPYSSKELRACYEQGAARFGWARRHAVPRSMREGHQLIGYGMATGIWEALLQPASARAVLGLDGRLAVSSATSDIGTGTYTVMVQVAADALGLPVERVTFHLGDSALPTAPLEGGSFTAASVGSAIKLACDGLRAQLLQAAQAAPDSPFAKVKVDEIDFQEGRLSLKSTPSISVTFVEAMRSAGKLTLEEEASFVLDPKRTQFSHYTHSAVFAEVRVDEDLGKIEVTRVVSAIAGGRILNPKTARSQILGGMVWGIGMALHEETVIDHALGRMMNHNFAEYHIPVNADIRDLEVIFVEEHDEHVNALGIKGLGEIGVVGVAAAIANAVFHATGQRIRSLPLTLDKLL